VVVEVTVCVWSGWASSAAARWSSARSPAAVRPGSSRRPSSNRFRPRWRTAAPAIANASVRSEIQIQSPGYQPSLRTQRRRSAGIGPRSGGRCRPHSTQYSCPGLRSAPQRGTAPLDGLDGVVVFCHQPALGFTITVSSPVPPAASSTRPQFGQKCDPRSTGAPQLQRGTWRWAWRRSSISASGRRCRRARRSLRRAGPPGASRAGRARRGARRGPRSFSSRTATRARCSRRSRPACGRRGVTPSAPGPESRAARRGNGHMTRV